RASKNRKKCLKTTGPASPAIARVLWPECAFGVIQSSGNASGCALCTELAWFLLRARNLRTRPGLTTFAKCDYGITGLLAMVNVQVLVLLGQNTPASNNGHSSIGLASMAFCDYRVMLMNTADVWQLLFFENWTWRRPRYTRAEL